MASQRTPSRSTLAQTTAPHATPRARPTRAERAATPSQPYGRPVRRRNTLALAVDDYLMVHRSEGHSAKTLEWHDTALGLLLRFLEQEIGIDDPHELETGHLRRWVVWLGTPESQTVRPGRTAPAPRSKRTIHTYARSAHAFGKWLHEEGLTDHDVTNHFTLPKLGKPLIRILEEDEFARLLLACEVSQYPREYVLRDRALLWVLYDTGIRLAEVAGLTLGSLDLRTGVLTVRGKGDKERRVALGANALAALRRYLDQGRPSLDWTAASSSVARADRLFLGAAGPLSRRGIDQIISRLKRRCGLADRRILPHIFRHTFAVRYLMLGGDPFSLQQLLGHEDMETIRNYMHLNDLHIQTQKRKFSPGDHVAFSATSRRRTGFRSR
jgi:site-specific recombinase XerD